MDVGQWCNAIYCLFLAFGMNLPFGACFTSVAIALTVALPQAGFAGVFHVAMTKTMLLWVNLLASAGFIVSFGLSFIPITILGLLALWKEGLSLKDSKKIIKFPFLIQDNSHRGS